MTKVWAGRGPHGIPAYSSIPSDLTPWDDLFVGTALAGKWTLRNINPTTEVSVASGHCTLTWNAQGDAMYQQPGSGNIGSAVDADIYGRFSSNNIAGNMWGLLILDSSGNGCGFSPYNDGKTYLWNVTGYAYTGTGPTTNDRPAVPGADYWLHVRKRGTNYTGRWANHDSSKRFDQQAYGSFTTALTRADAMDRVGVGGIWTAAGAGTCAHEEFRYRKA